LLDDLLAAPDAAGAGAAEAPGAGDAFDEWWNQECFEPLAAGLGDAIDDEDFDELDLDELELDDFWPERWLPPASAADLQAYLPCDVLP
jgi:hypothetical protein